MNTSYKTLSEIEVLLHSEAGDSATGLIDSANLSIIAALPINEGDAIRLCVTKGENESEMVETKSRPIRETGKTATFYQFEIRRNNSGSWRKAHFSMSAILRMPLKRCYWRGDNKQELLEFLDRSCLHKDGLFVSSSELITTLRKGVVANKIYRDLVQGDVKSPKCICFRAL